MKKPSLQCKAEALRYKTVRSSTPDGCVDYWSSTRCARVALEGIGYCPRHQFLYVHNFVPKKRAAKAPARTKEGAA